MECLPSVVWIQLSGGGDVRQWRELEGEGKKTERKTESQMLAWNPEPAYLGLSLDSKARSTHSCLVILWFFRSCSSHMWIIWGLASTSLRKRGKTEHKHRNVPPTEGHTETPGNLGL